MAYGDNSAIVTNRDALVFNQMYSNDAMCIFKRNNWLLNQLSGKPGVPNPAEGFVKSNNIDGRKLEVTFMGNKRTISTLQMVLRKLQRRLSLLRHLGPRRNLAMQNSKTLSRFPSPNTTRLRVRR